jgi:hypothetical protein
MSSLNAKEKFLNAEVLCLMVYDNYDYDDYNNNSDNNFNGKLPGPSGNLDYLGPVYHCNGQIRDKENYDALEITSLLLRS